MSSPSPAPSRPAAPEAIASTRRDLVAQRGLRGHGFSAAWRPVVDSWLVDQFAAATAGDGPDGPGPGGGGLALVAVGGYGRGDLTPGSDLDLLLLHRSKQAPALVAEAIWYPIWDAGLKLGHSVRTPADALALARDDLDTATSLLSMRHLAGDRELTDEVAEAAAAQWQQGKGHLGRLQRSVVERWARFGEVAFLLEPDLKEGRGGLRDVHALRWAEAARPVLGPGDAAALAEAETFLFEARVALHRVTGRANDVLSLQEQDAVAADLGLDADSLMAGVARAARKVAWVGDEAWDQVTASLSGSSVLLGWRSRRRAPGLTVRAGQVHLEPDADPAADPGLVLDMAVLAARKGVRPSRDTLSRLVERTPTTVEEPWTRARRDRFVALLAEGHRAISVIEALDHVGLWERYLPEWTVIRNRPQRNAYHRFTVDRHLLEAAANAAELTDRVDRPDLLVIGALLHDIGKGRPGDHTDVGVQMVGSIAPRMGFDEADTAVLVDLVRHHLLLPDVATRRDLTDPATIEAVAAAVGDRRRLHLLAAVTEADSLATGPAAWGAWKAGLVADLVRRVDHALDGGDPSVLGVDELPDARQRTAMATGETSVETDGDTITIIAPDRTGLFARVTGVLALHGLEVRTADVASEADMAIERFRVTSAFESMVAWDRVVTDVEAALVDRLAIEARLAERIRTYGRAAPGNHPPPSVRFDDAASNGATVVEVHAVDRLGLLYRVARAFSELGIDVSVAKVQTLGHQVVDAFYVTSDGDPVSDERVRAELTRALLHAVS